MHPYILCVLSFRMYEKGSLRQDLLFDFLAPSLLLGRFYLPCAQHCKVARHSGLVYLIGEFSYPVWNIATNEQSSDRPRDWWPGQVAASISSNESQFFSNISQSSPEAPKFIYFHNISLDILSLNPLNTELNPICQ